MIYFKLISYNSTGETITCIKKHNRRSFAKKLGTIFSQIACFKVYLKVGYGKQKDNFGKVTEFYNDGEYFNQKDLTFAYLAFTEDL